MNSLLFVGSFLSRHQGTLGVSEVIASELKMRGLNVKLCSKKKNKIIRILEILICCALSRYQILHIDIFSGPSFRIAELASLIGKWRGKKIVMTLRGGKLHEFYAQNEVRVNKILKQANLIVSPSNYLKRFFESKGFLVINLPNSIALEKFPYQQNLIQDKSLLWVRAFSNIYCPEVAIESLKIIREVYPDTMLTMVGPDKGKLEEIKILIDRYGLEKFVTITGPVPNDQLHRYYREHAVFLNTTTYESFGNCVVEAASCGIPIVSNKVGELPFIWEHESSICFFNDNNPDELATNVIRILNDGEFATKLKTNARKKSEEFEREKILNFWINHIFNDLQ